MSVLADFIEAERDTIVTLFTRRVRPLAPPSLTKIELADHLPDFLVGLAAALRHSTRPTDHVFQSSGIAESHGHQRLRLGFDLSAVVREYGLLRDCLFEQLEEAGITPTLRELRVLSDCLSGATSDSTEQYVQERQEGSDAERIRLLSLFQQAPG
ncbi:MAG TPA: RsbRD N-terminal domain-containing protein, partial [Myxococcaceae bacterium]|nr:RsbRD N-terminal domain-containing protein [Myxococcaceae bacterium]